MFRNEFNGENRKSVYRNKKRGLFEVLWQQTAFYFFLHPEMITLLGLG
jgi:hypothetical protein